MENKFIEGSYEVNENDELIVKWADGTNLIFDNRVVFSAWQEFMILSDFKRTKEELIEMCKLFEQAIFAATDNEGRLSPVFSFDATVKAIQTNFKLS